MDGIEIPVFKSQSQIQKSIPVAIPTPVFELATQLIFWSFIEWFDANSYKIDSNSHIQILNFDFNSARSKFDFRQTKSSNFEPWFKSTVAELIEKSK